VCAKRKRVGLSLELNVVIRILSLFCPHTLHIISSTHLFFIFPLPFQLHLPLWLLLVCICVCALFSLLGSIQTALKEPFPCARLTGAVQSEDTAAAAAAAVSAAGRFKRDFRPPLRRLFLQPYLETVRV